MKFFYVAPDTEVDAIYSSGVSARGRPEIPIIALSETFLMTKYIFDVYAHEVLNVDIYCAFEVLEEGLETAPVDSPVNHFFKDVFKMINQQHIERKFLKPFKSDQTYEGMGLIDGVFPVENRDKFTNHYKKKVLEYIKGVKE
jgi:hypothetical protein